MSTHRYSIAALLAPVMRQDLLSALLSSGVALPPSTPAPCQLVFGFRTLQDLIPQTVGDCVTDAQHNPKSGDAVQKTTRGLLAWRKSDDSTAFIDSVQTWTLGPHGLQERLNNVRFRWESHPSGLPVV